MDGFIDNWVVWCTKHALPEQISEIQPYLAPLKGCFRTAELWKLMPISVLIDDQLKTTERGFIKR